MNSQTSQDDNNKQNQAAFEQLSQLQQELSVRLQKLSADKSKSHSIDSSEQAVERENDEVIDQLESETRAELTQVESALKRIENGTYGICVKCGEDISAARLQVIPYTTFCINCAD